MRLTKIISAVLALLLTLSLTACGNSQPPPATNTTAQAANNTSVDQSASSADVAPDITKTIRIGFPGSSGDTPSDLLGIAKFSGILDEELAKVGAKAELIGFVGAGPAVNEAFVGESIDLATYNDFPAILLKSKGIDTKVVAINNRALTGRILVQKDSSIQSLSDLIGRKVGYMRGTGYQKQLWFAIESIGHTVDDIDAISFNSITEMEAALFAGDVDAITDTAMSTKVLEQARIISDTNDNPGWSGPWLSAVRSGYLKENRELVVAYVKALIKSREYAVTHKQEVVEYFAAAGNDPGQAELIYTDPATFPVEINQEAVDSITSSKEFLQSQGFLTADVDVDAWVDKSIHEDAIK
ncbi:aryl sulfate ester ABC transporter [Clostridia bacterium]|nr:aryl sulfate ester ABC transporter [Clostridia bacterium]